MLAHIGVAEIEFTGIRAPLDPQVPKARQAAALTRLRRYAGLEPGTTPLTQLAIDRTGERFGTPGLTGRDARSRERRSAERAWATGNSMRGKLTPSLLRAPVRICRSGTFATLAMR
jgi:hypothetical protein